MYILQYLTTKYDIEFTPRFFLFNLYASILSSSAVPAATATHSSGSSDHNHRNSAAHATPLEPATTNGLCAPCSLQHHAQHPRVSTSRPVILDWPMLGALLRRTGMTGEFGADRGRDELGEKGESFEKGRQSWKAGDDDGEAKFDGYLEGLAFTRKWRIGFRGERYERFYFWFDPSYRRLSVWSRQCTAARWLSRTYYFYRISLIDIVHTRERVKWESLQGTCSKNHSDTQFLSEAHLQFPNHWHG